MDKIEALIKKLEEAREELRKDSVNPKLAPKDVKVKELQGKIDSGTYKPDAGKIADKMLKGDKDKKETEKDAMDAELGKAAKDEMLACGEGCEMKDMKTHANGQWSMKKGAFKELEHKLEGEGKSKESAGAIAYTVGKEKYGKEGMERKAKAGEAKKSDEGLEKAKGTSSVYNAGTHPMKAREGTAGNFPHYHYDTSIPHEENMKQAKTHFEKHPHVRLNDSQLTAHVNQQKAKAQTAEKSDMGDGEMC